MPIQILPARLANQIAAGEVVERPASVVKELVENSLDAGSSQIHIEIERGGHKRILIRDNGGGIPEAELSLALSRHATSKIQDLDDLEAIQSLGFRGEALASISSVSRLTLTSKPKNQPQAWQARAEGRDMQVELLPAAHPNGTSVLVEDLFFNTPARRKFLRAEKTEFGHIDAWLKRMVLGNFNVSFSLHHNGKRVRHWPAASTEAAQLKRVAAVCGKGFNQVALELRGSYQQLALRGWLSEVTEADPPQYVFINGRVIRDKLVQHGIRQAYAETRGQEPSAYVLYLNLPHRDVDVNVHPAKHEVRFHQARVVHDFILRTLSDALEQGPNAGAETAVETTPMSMVAEPRHQYMQPLQEAAADTSKKSALSGSYTRATEPQRAANYTRLMTPRVSQPKVVSQYLSLPDGWLLLALEGDYWRLDLHKLLAQWLLHQQPISQPLLLPIQVPMQERLSETQAQALDKIGLQAQWHNQRLLIKQVPAGTRELDWGTLLPELVQRVTQDAATALAETLSAVRPALAVPLQNLLLDNLLQQPEQQQHDCLRQCAVPVPLLDWLSQQEIDDGR